MQDLQPSPILAPQNWAFPIPISYGPGRLAEMGERCGALGLRNPLIITDRGSKDLPMVAQLQAILSAADIRSDLFFDISPNPRDDEIGSGRHLFRQNTHDAVIAIGGGSAMDAGKAVCLTANNEFDLWAFDYDQPVPEIPSDQPFPTLITIPTTAGTGAETESFAMMTHVRRGVKQCIWHPKLKPSLALLDPELTLGLPPNLTAWTGADALTHAIEAYLVADFNPLCDGLALEALALISKWLPIAVQEPENMAARGGMLVGSCLAGVSFLKGLGLVHAISHMVGAEYNTHHGQTNAIILPVVLRFNLPGQEPKVKRMAQAMGLERHTVEEFVSEVETLLDEIGIPKSLGEIGVPADCADRIANKAMAGTSAATNPRLINTDEMRNLIQTAISKAR